MFNPLPRCATCRIKSLSLFRNCCPEILESLSDAKTGQTVKKGGQLLDGGSEAQHVYCIRTGVAKVSVYNGKGQSLLLRLEGKGGVLGYRGGRKKNRQPLTVTAAENMQVCHFNADQFLSIARRCQCLQGEIMKSLTAEINATEARALSLAHHTVRQRVAEALLHIAQVYHYRQNGCSIHVHLDRQDMASLAGTTKEQVSAVLAQLRREKLISFKAKHFKYFDLEGLAAVAQS